MSPARLRIVALAAAMAASVAAVAGLAFWDSARESDAALQDFAEAQETVARTLGAALAVRGGAAAGTADADNVLAGLRAIERPRSLAFFLHRADETTLRATDGRQVVSAPLLAAATGAGARAIRIARADAAALGLSPRTAMAGIARVESRAVNRPAFDIIAVASAERERDRGLWARRRLVLSVLTMVALVVAFGGWALRNQRKELVLERELVVAGLQQARDERLQRASKAAAMGTLAMGVAHEISTPLGVIVARAEQLAKTADDPRAAAGVAAILAQTGRINQVMRGLLGLARGDAPSAERLDPRALVENAIALVEHRFAKSGVRLFQDLAMDIPAVLGDPRLLEHAIVNLLLNACDACKVDGQVTVRLGARAGADATANLGAREVEIAIEDSGVGISVADLGRALEPFFTTKSREGGTGLGLAIAQEIVANHRGRLIISSAAPRGTRAAILLPPVEGQVHV